jgi:hypothetical protein
MPKEQSNSIEELRNRNIEYFVVADMKLIILSLCTLGLYVIYWMYKNWEAIALQGKEKITPWVYTLFGMFTCYGLFNRILLNAEAKGYVKKCSAGSLATLFISLNLLARVSKEIPVHLLSSTVTIITLFSFVPILLIQDAIRFNNSKVNPESKQQTKFSVFEIILSVVGGVFLILVVVGCFILR